MTQIIKRKTLLLMSVILTGLLSFFGSYLRGYYSKEASLIVPTAKADVPSTCGWCGCPWTDAQCTTWFSCFPYDTLIRTPTGDKEIQNLVEGDLVYGFNVETGEKGEYPVTKTFKHGKDDANTVYSPLLQITHEKGVLTLTDNHWVYRRNGRAGDYAHFDRAGMLQIGDVLTLENGEESVITQIENGPEYDFVYNLEVESVHTYFASGVRVHNTGGGGCSAGGGCGGCAAGGGK